MKKFLASLLLVAALVVPTASLAVPVFGLGGTYADNQTFLDGITIGSAGNLQGIIFGDGDTKFYEIADDSLSFKFGATDRFSIAAFYMGSSATGGAKIANASSSATTAGIIPSSADTNTGMGTRGVDCVTLIAGGVEGTSVCELGGVAAFYLPEITTPTAIPNYGAVYPKADNNLYFQDGAGVEHTLGGEIGKFKDYSHATGAAGDHYFAGYYNAPAADANLTQASTTVVLGTANVSYSAHAFVVSGSAGSTDGSDCVVTVSGTSITEAGSRSAADSEVIIADCTTESTDGYSETVKRWIGQVTYTLSSTGGSTFSHDFNYGYAKYEDFEDSDVTISSFECVGDGGANDSSFNVSLWHHKVTGWTYHASAFVAGDGAIADMNVDHNTETQIANGIPFAYKRTGLSTAINASGGEGIIIKLVTGSSNSIEHIDCHVGYTQ